jgi:glutamate 5-kinase
MYTWWNRPIVVKIWSESLADFVNSQKVKRLIMDIIFLMQEQSENILLVTSWAVSHGRILRPDINDKQVLAGIGNPFIYRLYDEKFQKNGIDIMQVLVTHGIINETTGFWKSLKKSVENSWNYGNIIPIINENDVITPEELEKLWIGADNDKNALLLAKLFNAKLLAIVTNTDWVLDESKSRITSIASNKLTPEYISYICDQKSQWWTWWMVSKLNVARQAWEIWKNWEPWIPTYIFDGKNSTLLEYINLAKEWTLDKLAWGTIIIP